MSTQLTLPGLPLFRFSRAVQVSPAINVLLVSIVISPANPNRIGFTVWNNSANSAYLTFGATASSASPTYIHPTFSTLAFFGPAIYTGVLSAIRNAGSGTMVVTEFFL